MMRVCMEAIVRIVSVRILYFELFGCIELKFLAGYFLLRHTTIWSLIATHVLSIYLFLCPCTLSFDNALSHDVEDFVFD